MRLLALAALIGVAAAPALAETRLRQTDRVCVSDRGAPDQVAEAVQRMYDAAKADDLEAFHAVVAPDFYAYDLGQAFAGDALMKLVAAAHAAGKTYEWTVTAPRVRLDCDTAWITYRNEGALTDATGRHPLQWLESAVLRYDGGAWRIQFLHSTRVP